MAIKIIVLDLDGTLLTSGKEISPANRAALEKAAANGVHIVPSTGRFYDGMPQLVRDLPFVRYVITVNGAQIYDAREKKVLHRAEIPLEEADQVYARMDQLPVIYDSFIDGWGYMDRTLYDRIDEYITAPHVKKMAKELRKPVENFRAFVRENGKPVQKIQMFFKETPADMALRETVWADFIQAFPHMSVTSSISNNVEVNDRHANKGEALAFLCQHLGVDIRDTMSFGDGSNDRSMIEAAGVGVAMANADESLKAAADYVTDTNDNDGVAKAMEKFCF